MTSAPRAEAGSALITLLEQLLDQPALELDHALVSATQSVAEWLQCDKVDAFVLDPARQSLVAVGTSPTPLGELQKALGLDMQPLANGGRVVTVFRDGLPYITGRADLDEEELRGVVRDLGVRSTLNVPLEINGVRRGVLSAVSQQPERFSEADLQQLGLVARWCGAIAHRAELVERLRSEEAERGRRVAADEVVTVLAHDVRNHLNPLSSRLQWIRLKVADGKGVAPGDLDPAISAIQRLSRLTDDLLDVARLDAGLFELSPAPVDLAALARDVGATLATPTAEVQVIAEPSLVVVADADRLRQALENVVANALKYSPSGRPVRIVVEPDSSKGCVQVDVIDQGEGISPELLSRLFRRFASARGSKGLGLGLYLADRIARAHGGSLRVDSQPGAGARFRFSLPVDGAQSASES